MKRSTSNSSVVPSSPQRQGSGGLASRLRTWLREERYLVLLAIAFTTLLFTAIYVVLDNGLQKWTDRDLGRRAKLIWHALSASPAQSAPELSESLERIAEDDRVVGILACDGDRVAAATNVLARQLTCSSSLVRASLAAEGTGIAGRIGNRDVHVTSHRLGGPEWLVVVQDRGFIRGRRQRILQVVLIAGELALLSLIFLGRVGVNSGRRRFNRAARDLVWQLRSGLTPDKLPADLEPLALEVDDALRALRIRSAPQDDESGPARLRRLVSTEMPGEALVVVANREPYSHDWTDSGSVRLHRPASGLVSGIEPLLRACGGTWVAHGGGSADRQVTPPSGRIGVPPDHPEYVLRRVFLSEQELDGYYFGFSNEGLWPLCHIAHTRPTFRPSDWEAYQTANRKFAEATVREAADGAMILVQDYHFAVLPRMIRERMSDAVISLFWHIPWPNSEVIGICPWSEELLDGMLGADVLGFHTRYHCLNFLDTAQRYLECRVDFESMSVEYNRHRTLVRPYPISVEWPYPAAPRSAGSALRQSLGIAPEAQLLISVDRTDYTKGIIERIDAIETLLETHPELVGEVVFVQLAAPSRTRIKRYRDVISELEEAALRVNRTFGRGDYKPVIVKLESFSPEDVRMYYAAANVAVVTPLHDGMNLVAKEYVAACADNDGALVLSRFAGAAKELEGALIVNPYDAAEVAEAIHQALRMPPEERRGRMEMMRRQIAANSIYDWSEKLLRDMAEVRRRRQGVWGNGERVTSDLEAGVPW